MKRLGATLFGWKDGTLRGALLRSYFRVNLWTVLFAILLLSLIPLYDRAFAPEPHTHLNTVARDTAPIVKLLGKLDEARQRELLNLINSEQLRLLALGSPRDAESTKIYGLEVEVNTTQDGITLIRGDRVSWSQRLEVGALPPHWAARLSGTQGTLVFEDSREALRDYLSPNPVWSLPNLRVTTMFVPIAEAQWLAVSAIRPFGSSLALVLVVMYALVVLTWGILGTLPITASAALISGLLARRQARRLAQPLTGISVAAQRIAAGDLDARSPIAGPQEVQNLAADINTIGANLSRTLHDLERAREQAEQALRSQRTFIGNVSHDLRTPLSSILAFSEDLEQHLVGTPHARKVQVVLHEAQALRRMVDDLFDLVRMDSASFAVDVRAVDIARVVSEVASGLAPVAWQRGVLVRAGSALPTTGWPITGWADEQRLAQVLRNLVVNAVRHTPEGGLVELSVTEDQDEVVITVVDTGTGIPADDLPFIFDRFYRVEKSRARTGGERNAGLGLAICKELLEKMQGEIRVCSQEGVGTTFELRLPARRPTSYR